MCSPDPERMLLLAPFLAALAAAGPTPVVLIDGPSGAGKSTLADALVLAWPGMVRPVLVRLDDIYPGWNGLDAAVAQLTDHILGPRRRGAPGAWQRYDWERGQPAEWHLVDPARPLIVEGCGALAAANLPLSDIRVWLDADDRLRKQRALARDGEAFRSHWDQWQSEWEAYRNRERPERQATIRLAAAGNTAGSPAGRLG
ncbi:ATP-binding protein [Cryobacterium sp. TMT2-10]|uniref:ATP-binding protein n=1 Tax=Cryobacterium sp. TMT2-10 TaxID=1259244 RepID=UPI001F546C21|nr:ATP-binding protein [Cryobacterium sp. TMT2-10]